MRQAENGADWVGAEDLLFLMPGRALAEEKTGAIIDVERYFSAKEAQTQDVMGQLRGKLFLKYPNPQLEADTLGVEAQQVVPVEAETADGRL